MHKFKDHIENAMKSESEYYHYQVAKHLAHKDGHNFDKLPEYDRRHDKHKEAYRGKAKAAIDSGRFDKGIHEEAISEYRKPTQAEIDADKKKDQAAARRAGKQRPSMDHKSINKKLYVNMQPKLKEAEELEEAPGKYAKRGDQEKYQWGDINKAMMDAGMNPRSILNVLTKLSGKSLKEESCDCDCGKSPCVECGEDHHDVSEAGCSSSLNASSKYADKKKKLKEAAPRIKKATGKGEVVAKGLRNKRGVNFDVTASVVNGKLEFRIKDEFGSFTTVGIKQAAKILEDAGYSADQLAELNEEQLEEIIGKAVGGAFKVAAKAAVGAGRLAKKAVVNKQGNVRTSAAGKADSAEKKAAAQEKKNRDRERIKAAQDRLRKAKEAARNK